MADIFKLVDYDATSPVIIHSDKTGDVVFQIRTIENKDAQKIISKRRASSMGKRAVSGKGNLSEDELGELLADMIEPGSDVLATCITSWAWNGHEFNGEVDPEFTPENVSAILDLKWIKDKVHAAAQSLAGFTKA